MGALFAFLGTALGRKLIVAVAILALALGAYLYIYNKGRAAGTAADTKATIEQQKRIDDAKDRGPRTLDDVNRRLRDGRF